MKELAGLTFQNLNVTGWGGLILKGETTVSMGSSDNALNDKEICLAWGSNVHYGEADQFNSMQTSKRS